MKKLIFLLTFMILSCTKDTQRISMECYIYDFSTKAPINNVEITQLLDGKNVILTKTSTKGYFKVDKLTQLSLGMESRNLASLIFLKKEGYITDTIEIYGGTNDTYKRDSIFLKKF